MLGTLFLINEINSLKCSAGKIPSLEISSSQSIISSPVFSSIIGKEKGSTESKSFLPSSSLSGNLNRSSSLLSFVSSTFDVLTRTFLHLSTHSSWHKEIEPIKESSIISKSFSERFII